MNRKQNSKDQVRLLISNVDDNALSINKVIDKTKVQIVKHETKVMPNFVNIHFFS